MTYKSMLCDEVTLAPAAFPRHGGEQQEKGAGNGYVQKAAKKNQLADVDQWPNSVQKTVLLS
jgi:hypothetical protein